MEPLKLKPIPITVFTGFLGVGKTSVILSLLPKLPKDYKVVLLKNEFGDIAVDSQLAQQSSLTAVSEILNGCMCCVLVGQMKTALLEIREKYRPDRIIIECSGSAFPATLAFQIRELERETSNDLTLDAIVTVIDAENFAGYEDTSPTAKMQAEYTDLLLINKHEHATERQLDDVIDHLNTLNELTPKVKCGPGGNIDPDIIFGLDSKLFTDLDENFAKGDTSHHDEVQTVTIHRGELKPSHVHDATCGHAHEAVGSSTHTDVATRPVDEAVLKAALDALSKESVWRVKGFILLPAGMHILNWAFGRYELTKVMGAVIGGADDNPVKLTVMGERGEVKRRARKLAEVLGADIA